MSCVGFDAKDFVRQKRINNERVVAFYTPLGVGVLVKDTEELRRAYVGVSKRLGDEFDLPIRRLVYSSEHLMKTVGPGKAVAFCDRMIQELIVHIDSVFVSYVVLPPKELPNVEVGGYYCPKETIPTMDFLRRLSPMFSYITAWSYLGRHMYEDRQMLIDGFSSKHTSAWLDLTKLVKPKIFPRGDECNACISLADMLACLTDKKLWNGHLRLEPPGIESAWDDYNFEVEVRFLDEKVLSKYSWKSRDDIDYTSFLARPMLFLDIGGLAMKQVTRMDPFAAATAYAFHKGGGVQGFDPKIDSGKIRDGDVYVYAGEDAEARAKTFADMYDIEIVAAKELTKRIREGGET